MGLDDKDFEPGRGELCYICDQGIERSVLLARMASDAKIKASYYRGGMIRLVGQTDEEIVRELKGKFASVIGGGRERGAGDRQNQTISKLKKLGIPYVLDGYDNYATHIWELSGRRIDPRDYKF